MSSSNDIILGIDLGTTTSEAAIYDKKKIKMMHDGNGDEIIISAIGINPKTKKQIGLLYFRKIIAVCFVV